MSVTHSLPPAVLIYAPDGTIALCRSCAFDHLPTDHDTEHVPPENVGCRLLCDHCEHNIHDTIDD
jgi:hypothetical protein